MCRAEQVQLPAVAPAMLALLERIRVLEEKVAAIERRQSKRPTRVKRNSKRTQQ